MCIGGFKASGAYADRIVARIYGIDAKCTAFVSDYISRLAGLLGGDGDAGSGDNSSGLVAHDAGDDSFAGLSDGGTDGRDCDK